MFKKLISMMIVMTMLLSFSGMVFASEGGDKGGRGELNLGRREAVNEGRGRRADDANLDLRGGIGQGSPLPPASPASGCLRAR